jgi:hypothetical protein
MSNKSKKEEVAQPGIKLLKTIDPTLSEFIGHTFLKERTEAARKLLQRVGLPKHLTDKGYSVE